MTVHELPPAKKVLILAPHPDDEALGCGGAIALYSSKGAEVHLIVVSSGENILMKFAGDIDIAKARERETLEASKVLGIKNVYFLRFPDGQLLLHNDKIRENLQTLISDIQPDIIFAPSPLDYHDDHRTLSQIAIKFIEKGCSFKVAFYEVYGLSRFNTLVDISDVISIKEKAIMNYHYSLYEKPAVYCEAIKGLNRFESFYMGQLKYYEAFWLVSGKMTQSEIYSWLTYGMNEPPDNIKVVDKLLHEIDMKNQVLLSKESEIAEISKAKNKALDELADLKSKLEAMEESLMWRFGRKYYAIRDRILPEGSFQRKIYNHLLKCLKKGQT